MDELGIRDGIRLWFRLKVLRKWDNYTEWRDAKLLRKVSLIAMPYIIVFFIGVAVAVGVGG